MFVGSVTQAGAAGYVMLRVAKEQHPTEPVRPVDPVKSLPAEQAPEIGWLEALTSFANLANTLARPVEADPTAQARKPANASHTAQGAAATRPNRPNGSPEEVEADENPTERAHEPQSFNAVLDRVTARIQALIDSGRYSEPQQQHLADLQTGLREHWADSARQSQQQGGDWLDNLKDAFDLMTRAAELAMQETPSVVESAHPALAAAALNESAPAAGLSLETLREVFAAEVEALRSVLPTRASGDRPSRDALPFRRAAHAYRQYAAAPTASGSSLLSAVA